MEATNQGAYSDSPSTGLGPSGAHVAADANLAAEVYLRAPRHAVPEIPPLAHPDDEVRQWMHRVLDEQEAWLAVADDGTLLGLMVLDSDWVEQLYMDPVWTGRGLGTRFVELAKQRRPGGCSCGRSIECAGPAVL